VLGLALAVAAIGCAKKAPPSGGPPDLDPPTVIASDPDSGVAGVPRDAQPTITFSEGMEPRSTNDAVAFAPRVDIRQWRWSGRTLRLVLAESLRVDQTYTLFVGGGARDRHGNPLKSGASLVFTTAESLPAGLLEGEINARGFAAAGTYLWCYREGREPDSTARDYDALGLADSEGRFRVVGLPVPGRYRLWAFADLNRNRSFEPTSDLLAPADTSLELTASAPQARGLVLTVVNPTAPGKVKGTVLDFAPESEGVPAVLAVSQRDSAQRLIATVNDRGEFELSLEPGVWVVRAFRDLDENRGWSRGREPVGPASRIDVAPASELTDVKLELPAMTPEAAPPDSMPPAETPRERPEGEEGGG
jgi:hypothetical protein